MEQLSRYHVIRWLLRQSNKRSALCVTFSLPWHSVLAYDSTVKDSPICWGGTCIFLSSRDPIRLSRSSLLTFFFYYFVLFYLYTCNFNLKHLHSRVWIFTCSFTNCYIFSSLLHFYFILSYCNWWATLSALKPSKRTIYKGQFLPTSCCINLHHFLIYNILFCCSPDPLNWYLNGPSFFFAWKQPWGHWVFIIQDYCHSSPTVARVFLNFG